MPILQGQCKIHRLQGYQYPAKAFNQSRQDILTQAQRQLCRLPEKSEKGNQTRQVYGTSAVYRVENANREVPVANCTWQIAKTTSDMRLAISNMQFKG